MYNTEASLKLLKAAKEREFHDLKVALSENADPNFTNDDGETSLMILLGTQIPWEYTIESFEAVEDRNNFSKLEDALNLLYLKGARINIYNKFGQHPIFYAAISSSTVPLEWLIEKGLFNANVRDQFRNNCLYGKIKNYEPETIDCKNLAILLTLGVNHRNKNLEIVTPRTFCCQSSDTEPHICGFFPFKKKIQLLKQGRDYAINSIDTDLTTYVFELKNMNLYTFAPHKTLYDVLFMNRKAILRYVDNKNLMHVLKCNKDNVLTEFPEMGIFLIVKIFHAHYRKYLKVRFIQSLEILLLSLPDHVIEKIIFWLSDIMVHYSIIGFQKLNK